MKTFKLYYKMSDTCGNSNSYLVGYFQAENIEKAQKCFPIGFAMLRRFIVEELKLSNTSELMAKVGYKVENGEYR